VLSATPTLHKLSRLSQLVRDQTKGEVYEALAWCEQQASNLRTRIFRPTLCRLSYVHRWRVRWDSNPRRFRYGISFTD
jgi:hypothetical protein